MIYDLKNLNGTQISNMRRCSNRIGIDVQDYIDKLISGLKWCNNCKKFLDKSLFLNNYCKECYQIKRLERREKEYESNKLYRNSLKGKFSEYKRKARVRKIGFSLSYNDFLNLSGKKCFYCNGDIEIIGIDRVINTLGYYIHNVVPCCYVCNLMKYNYDICEWILHINKIVNNADYTSPLQKDNLLFSKKYKFCAYKNDALKRGITFGIDYEGFIKFWGVPCSYCNSSINTIGLDRIDNNCGYVTSNINSCCKVCNIMKSNHNLKFWTEKMKEIVYNFDPISKINIKDKLNERIKDEGIKLGIWSK